MSGKKHEKRSNYNEHHAEVACWSDTFWPGHTSCLLFDLNKSSASAGLKPADLSWKHNEDNASKLRMSAPDVLTLSRKGKHCTAPNDV